MDRMFDEFFAPSIASGRPLVRFGDWRSWEGLPRVDIVEHPADYTLRAEVPGFSKDDIQLNCTENSVTLKGEYKEESEAEGEGECYVCQESALGSFERTIGLPGEINVEGVKATLKDGVLTLHLPKKEVQHLKQIEVQAA
jgi:HSP20 family protein